MAHILDGPMASFTTIYDLRFTIYELVLVHYDRSGHNTFTHSLEPSSDVNCRLPRSIAKQTTVRCR